jgi:hypothetical protein
MRCNKRLSAWKLSDKETICCAQVPVTGGSNCIRPKPFRQRLVPLQGLRRYNLTYDGRKVREIGGNGRMWPDSLAVLLFHCLNMSIIQQLGVVGEQQNIVKTCRSYDKLIGWITMELAGQLG